MATKLTRKQIKELFIYATNDVKNWIPNSDNDLVYKFSDNSFNYDGTMLQFKQKGVDSRMIYPRIPIPIIPYNYGTYDNNFGAFLALSSIYSVLCYFVIAAPLLYGLIAISNSFGTDIPVGNGKVLLYNFMFHPILLTVVSVIFRLSTLKYVRKLNVLEKIRKQHIKSKKQEQHEKENEYFYELVESNFKKQARKEKLDEIENNSK